MLNAAAENPLAFHKKNANGAYVRQAGFDAAAERLVITGFGQLDKEKISVARGTKGVAPQKQESVVNFADSAIASAVGGELVVKFKIKSFNLESEFAQWNGEYKEHKTYVLPVIAGDTSETLAQKLKHSIDQEHQDPYTGLLVAGAVSENGTTGTFNLPVSGIRKGFEFELIVEHDSKTAGNISVSMSNTKEAYEGRGSYRQLNILRLQTPGRMQPYNFEQKDLPIEGDLYSHYIVTFNVERPDLHGSAVANGQVAGTFQLELYVNESRCAAWVTDFTKWLNANVAERHMHKADTANEVLGANEEADLQITGTVTTAGDVTVTLDGVAKTVAVALNDTPEQVATKIRATSFAGWTVSGSSSSVKFVSNTIGVKTDAAYSAGTTGAAGSITTVVQGAAKDEVTSGTAVEASPYTTVLS